MPQIWQQYSHPECQGLEASVLSFSASIFGLFDKSVDTDDSDLKFGTFSCKVLLRKMIHKV